MTYHFPKVEVDSQVEHRDKCHGEIDPQIIPKHSCKLVGPACHDIDRHYPAVPAAPIPQFAGKQQPDAH